MKLRPFDPETDFDALRSWISGSRAHALWCANRFRYPLEKADLTRVLAGAAQEKGDNARTAVDEGGAPAGFLSFSPDRAAGECRLKFVIVDPDLRGRGAAREMLRLAAARAFEDPAIGRIALSVFAENARAVRCYERVGFSVDRIDEKAFAFMDERWDRCRMILRR